MGLVALPVFKTGGPAKSGPVGSIPTRLRHLSSFALQHASRTPTRHWQEASCCVGSERCFGEACGVAGEVAA